MRVAAGCGDTRMTYNHKHHDRYHIPDGHSHYHTHVNLDHGPVLNGHGGHTHVHFHPSSHHADELAEIPEEND